MNPTDEDLDFERDVRIDKYSLEQCLVNQAELYAKWTAKWADAVREKARAKEALEIVKSELAQRARKSWDILGFPKAPTDQMVNLWVPCQHEYLEANTIYIETSYRANVLENARWAFDHRSRALSDLIKLYLAGYYADEKSVGKEARELLEDIRREKHEEELNIKNQKKLLKRRE